MKHQQSTLEDALRVLLVTYGWQQVRDTYEALQVARYGCPLCGQREKDLLFAGWNGRGYAPRWWLLPSYVQVSHCPACGDALPILLADPTVKHPNAIGATF